MRTILKSSIPVALVFCTVITSCAGQGQKNNKPMDTQETQPQQRDTTRLLSVANVEQQSNAGKVIASFFETPQVFEFTFDNKGQSMFNLLKEAKEKQWPVNVHSTSDKNGNRIINVLPATEAQLAAYNKEKAGRVQPVPVPVPKNN
jgi:hypothetical protein